MHITRHIGLVGVVTTCLFSPLAWADGDQGSGGAWLDIDESSITWGSGIEGDWPLQGSTHGDYSRDLKYIREKDAIVIICNTCAGVGHFKCTQCDGTGYERLEMPDIIVRFIDKLFLGDGMYEERCRLCCWGRYWGCDDNGVRMINCSDCSGKGKTMRTGIRYATSEEIEKEQKRRAVFEQRMQAARQETAEAMYAVYVVRCNVCRCEFKQLGAWFSENCDHCPHKSKHHKIERCK